MEKTATPATLTQQQSLSETSSVWRSDLLAGLTTGILAVPQGIAFALIANVPPEHGLYAMIVPTIVAALIRNSPFLITGATNTSALVIGALVASLAVPEPERVPMMLLITLLMGLIQVFFGVFRLGNFGRYVSQAVLVGFTLGAATLIFCDQIKNVLGVKVEGSPSLVQSMQKLLPHLSETDWRALLIAAVTMTVLIVCTKISRLIPAAMIAVAAAGLAVWAFGWKATPPAGIHTVDQIPRTLPGFTWPALTWAEANRVAAPSLAIAILGMVEAISIGKALSSQARIKFYPNQELFAKGVGNVAGAFTGCLPTSASWTRSAINLQMGAKTRWVGVIAGLTVLAIMLLLAPCASYVPKACLGAIIMWIAWRMVDLNAAKYVWRWSRTDSMVLIITYVSTLIFEIQYAIYLGVLVSLLLLVRRAGTLHMVQMAEGAGGQLREIEIDAETGKHPIVLLQLEGDLFFGVVDELEEKLESIAANGAKVIVIRLKRAHAIDATASETLASFVAHYKQNGGRMIFCGVRADLAQRIRRSHLGEVLGEANLLLTGDQPFRSVQMALDAAKQTVLSQPGASVTGRLIRQVPPELEKAWNYSI